MPMQPIQKLLLQSRYRTFDPIHLTAEATVASNSATGVNTTALKNPTGGAMEINQIKFEVQQPTYINGYLGLSLGGTIACKLELGSHALTNGFVPFWSFVKCVSLSSELVRLNRAPTIANMSEFCWTLPKSVYVPPGATITPSFQHLGFIQQSLNVRISYGGWTYPLGAAPPRKLFLPYASAYLSKVFDANAADSDESSELNIVNPFKTPLFLQRLTGRAQFIQSINGNPLLSEGFVLGSDNTGATCGEELMSIQIFDSNGRPIVRDPTILRSVFPTLTRSWEMDNGAVMDPESFYKVFITKSVPLAGSSNGAAFCQAAIGAVGWREAA